VLVILFVGVNQSDLQEQENLYLNLLIIARLLGVGLIG
jgi:hypothetical protein